MKPQALLLAAALAVPSLCAADPFSEFRIPDHSWRSGAGRFDAWASLGRSSDGSYMNTGRSATGQFDATLALGRDSERLSRSFVVDVEGSRGGARSEASFAGGTPASNDRTDESTRRAVLQGAQRSYLGASSWSVGGGAFFRADFTQSSRRLDQVSMSTYRSLNRGYQSADDYSYAGSAVLSAGRGRVRDATVVMDVHVLEQRLLDAGAIAGPLSPATRERLAAVLLAGGEIGSAHERPDRFFWREVERVLREGGALGDAGLDAYAVMRVREPYALVRLSRARGENASLLVEWRHDHGIRRTQDEYAARYLIGDSLVFEYRDAYGDRTSSGADDVFVGVQGEFHRPLGWRWQVDAAGAVSVPISTDDDGLSAAGRLSADWIVADRWRAGASFASVRSYLRHGDAPVPYQLDGWNTQVAALLSWFVEDHLSLDARWASRQGRQNYLSLTHRYDSVHQLSLGLTYRFLGRFDAPGLIEPMRPLL